VENLNVGLASVSEIIAGLDYKPFVFSGCRISLSLK
jgi:hypothetical protein